MSPLTGFGGYRACWIDSDSKKDRPPRPSSRRHAGLPTPLGSLSGTTVTPDVLCTYPSGSFGELAGNLTGLLATEKNNTTPFGLEADTAPEFYVTGNPSAASPAVRTLDRDVGSLTACESVHRNDPADH